jgi:polysaccharide pyruvyl transferase WcaK-like protein
VFTSDSVDEPTVAQIVADVRARHPGLAPSLLVSEPVPSLAELLRQTATVGTVVATRFHHVLYSLVMDRPTIAIGYAAKHEALMRRLELSRYYQEARSLDVDRLIRQFTELEDRAATLRVTIAERNADLARQVDGQFRELSAILFPADNSRSRLAPLSRLPRLPRVRVSEDARL